MSIYSRMSSTAKLIVWGFTLPLILIALYLYWSDSELMLWVDSVKNEIISENARRRLANKTGAVIVILSVGIPAMMPALAYDFFTKKGFFQNT